MLAFSLKHQQNNTFLYLKPILKAVSIKFLANCDISL